MKKKQKALRKIFLTALLFVTISFAATRLFQVPEAAATQNITGWFWSSTAGWVSLSCQNTNSCSEVSYGVIEQADGLWTGYGWSDNLGWLRFDAGCPNGLSGQCGAKRIGDTIQGFARFCAPSLANSTCGRVTQTTTTPGGSSWDGWVSLSSQNDHISGHDNGAISPSPYVYGLTWSNNQLEGFVWGGQQVVGWMKYVAQVTECSDNVDNTDTEDEFADEVDPGCHTDGNVNNPLSYDPNDTS
ncbi:hypothetical protein IT401_02695, partial [Candidatus Nomurabacteria bacterium]|nr:hypothetical protein [Candidatus Nomurabacteria bacterium]